MEEVLKPDEAEAAIEALLFTMGEAISAEATQDRPHATTKISGKPEHQGGNQ